MDYGGEERRKDSFHESFLTINVKLAEIEIAIATLANTVDSNHKIYRANHEEVRAVTIKHDNTLYGNGNIGLTSKVNELKDVAHDLRAINGKISFAAGVAITVSTLIGWFIKIISG